MASQALLTPKSISFRLKIKITATEQILLPSCLVYIEEVEKSGLWYRYRSTGNTELLQETYTIKLCRLEDPFDLFQFPAIKFLIKCFDCWNVSFSCKTHMYKISDIILMKVIHSHLLKICGPQIFSLKKWKKKRYRYIQEVCVHKDNLLNNSRQVTNGGQFLMKTSPAAQLNFQFIWVAGETTLQWSFEASSHLLILNMKT